MNIAIISDIHDNFHNLIVFLKTMPKYDIDQILCLGDLINPGVAKTLASFPVPVTTIWGNNDGDKAAIINMSNADNSNLKVINNNYGELTIENKKIFITHYPVLAKIIAKSGSFDAVFYGHNHLKHKESLNNCIIANPGEISANRTGIASFAIYNTENNDVEIIDLENTVTTKTKESADYLKSIGM